MGLNLTNQYISSSFKNLLQISGSDQVTDGTGSLVTDLDINVSNAVSSSFATTASYAENVNVDSGSWDGQFEGDAGITGSMTFSNIPNPIQHEPIVIQAGEGFNEPFIRSTTYKGPSGESKISVAQNSIDINATGSASSDLEVNINNTTRFKVNDEGAELNGDLFVNGDTTLTGRVGNQYALRVNTDTGSLSAVQAFVDGQGVTGYPIAYQGVYAGGTPDQVSMAIQFDATDTGSVQPTLYMDSNGNGSRIISEEFFSIDILNGDPLTINAPVILAQNATGSLLGTASHATYAETALTASYMEAEDVEFDDTNFAYTASNVQIALQRLSANKADISQLTSNVNTFPTTASADVGGYFALVTSSVDARYNEPSVDVPTGPITGTGQLISSLITDGALFTGNPGIVNINTAGQIRRVGGSGEANFYYEVYTRSGSTETLISTSDTTQQVDSNVYEEFNASAILNNVTFTSDDRIVLKFYGNKVGGGSNPSYEFMFGGTQPVRTIFPVPATVLVSPWNGQFTGDAIISGTLNVTEGITGSLQGNADTATSSSHADLADNLVPGDLSHNGIFAQTTAMPGAFSEKDFFTVTGANAGVYHIGLQDYTPYGEKFVHQGYLSEIFDSLGFNYGSAMGNSLTGCGYFLVPSGSGGVSIGVTTEDNGNGTGTTKVKGTDIQLTGSVSSQNDITAPNFIGNLTGNAATATTASYALTSADAGNWDGQYTGSAGISGSLDVVGPLNVNGVDQNIFLQTDGNVDFSGKDIGFYLKDGDNTSSAKFIKGDSSYLFGINQLPGFTGSILTANNVDEFKVTGNTNLALDNTGYGGTNNVNLASSNNVNIEAASNVNISGSNIVINSDTGQSTQVNGTFRVDMQDTGSDDFRVGTNDEYLLLNIGNYNPGSGPTSTANMLFGGADQAFFSAENDFYIKNIYDGTGSINVWSENNLELRGDTGMVLRGSDYNDGDYKVTVRGYEEQTFNAPGPFSQKNFLNIGDMSFDNGLNYTNTSLNMQHYGGDTSNYKKAFLYETWDSFGYNFGTEFLVGPKRSSITMVPSGSGFSHQSYIETIQDSLTSGTSKLKMAGPTIKIGDNSGFPTTTNIETQSDTYNVNVNGGQFAAYEIQYNNPDGIGASISVGQDFQDSGSSALWLNASGFFMNAVDQGYNNQVTIGNNNETTDLQLRSSGSVSINSEHDNVSIEGQGVNIVSDVVTSIQGAPLNINSSYVGINNAGINQTNSGVSNTFEGSTTFEGEVTFNGGGNFGQVDIGTGDIVSSTGSIDLSAAQQHWVNQIPGETHIEITNGGSGRKTDLLLFQSSTGSLWTFADNINWIGGSAPSIPVSNYRQDLIRINSFYGGDIRAEYIGTY